MTSAPAAVLALMLAACSTLRPAERVVVRVDTVTVTKQVAAPLASGDTVELCLSNGLPVKVLVAANGDTLVGDARASLKLLRPVLTFSGGYAAEQRWFATDTLTFEKRVYRKTGAVRRFACDELKEVGSYGAVPVFARVTEMSTLFYIVLPISPGVFQPYTVPPSLQRRRR